MARPLEGLKVLDFSRVLAGPYATRMLSDLGAEVLKVEPPEGDVTRHFGHRIGEQSGYYVQQNVGKQNICIDMKAPGARELILKLAEKADIVVENFRPGVMDRFGTGWKDLSAVNPKLVMLSISGFGQTGPDVKRAAYAPIVHAETGIIDRQAQVTGHEHVDFSFSLADTYSSLHGLVGVLSAVLMAQRTGKGQHVDIAMIDVVHSVDDFASYALDGVWPYDNRIFVWEAPEDKRILISGDMKWLWYVFSRREGMADPAPEGADLETKIRLRRDAIAERIRTFESFDTLTAKLDELNLAWGLVRTFAKDNYDQATLQHRGTVIEVDDRDGGKRRTIQAPYRFSNAESGIAAGAVAPKRGEHNAEALAEWIGLGAAEAEALTEAGILRTEEADAAEDAAKKAG